MPGLRWSPEQLAEYQRHRKSVPGKKKPHRKYRNHPVGTHASEREHGRAAELHLLESCGDISDLKEQVWFELIPGADGEKPVFYVADFTYADKSGALVVEDTKGFRTGEYIIKRKLMRWRYGIRIREV